MRIGLVVLQGFQCFADRTEVDLDQLTVLIGSNGVGKTALLIALARLFGGTRELRSVRTEDFHVPPAEELEDVVQRNLAIEVRLEFPELQNQVEVEAEDEELEEDFEELRDDASEDGPDQEPEGAGLSAVPPFFSRMVVGAPGEVPYCRARLEATWSRSATEQGDIQEARYWVLTAEPDTEETKRKEIRPNERARVLVQYIPATRDASRELANMSGTMLNRLLRAVEWPLAVQEQVKAKSQELQGLVEDVKSVALVSQTAETHWSELHDRTCYSNVALRFGNGDLPTILRNARMAFSPSPDGPEAPISRLSEGQQNLFYIAFIRTLSTISRLVHLAHQPDATQAQKEAVEGIAYEELRPPDLTLFAVEEPENHLSPHFLGRVMEQLLGLSQDGGAQVLITSHSPAIVSRVDPGALRYLRLDDDGVCSVVKRVLLPEPQDEAFKYVKEAVCAYPELYFSRLVVLGEGDSEEVVLKRLAILRGTPLDTDLVSVVPLGGRFMHHFWRLLHDLAIPHITLLDLDLGRSSGGWAVVKNALSELLKAQPECRDGLLEVEGPAGKRAVLTQQRLDGMHQWAIDRDLIMGWVRSLRDYDVFCIGPLDLDFLMLQAFTGIYMEAVEGGQGPDQTDIGKLSERILGEQGAERVAVYKPAERELFAWYSYLFLNRSKPLTHHLALSSVSAPPPLPKPLDLIFRRIDEITER